MTGEKKVDYFIPIHCEVAEALSQINLSPYESRVLWAVFRKTYGYKDNATGLRKKADIISCSQIASMCGLDKRVVSRALRGLLKKGVLFRDGNLIGLNKEFIKRVQGVSRDTVKRGVSRDTQKVSVETLKGVSRDTLGGVSRDTTTINTSLQERFTRKHDKKGKCSAVGSTSFGPKSKPEKPKPVFNKGNTALMQEIVDYWNKKAPCPNSDNSPRYDLVKVVALSETRKVQLRARLKEQPFRENWKKAIYKVAMSNFCRGSSERGWRTSFDWFIGNDTNYIKVLEGKYDDTPEDDPLAEQKIRQKQDDEQVLKWEEEKKQREEALTKLPLEEQQKIKANEKAVIDRAKFTLTLGYNLRKVRKETSPRDVVFWQGFISTLSNMANAGIPLPELYKKYQDVIGRCPEVDIVAQILSDYDRKLAEMERVMRENYGGAKR